MLAAKLDKHELVKLLLSQAQATNSAGVNAFFIAVAHGSLESARHLQDSADFQQTL